MSAPTHLALTADASLRRIGDGVWVGGSPLVMFRVTGAGDELIGSLLGADREVGLSVNGRVAHSLLDRLVLAGAAHPVPTVSASSGDGGGVGGVGGAVGPEGVGGVGGAVGPEGAGGAGGVGGAGAGAVPAAGSVTVVVPVRDNPDGLAGLLDGLLADQQVPGRVIVVDDGSADPSGTAAVAAARGAEVIRHEHPQGPAAARNSGLAEVRTGVVAFLDSDVEVAPGWLSPLLAHLFDGRVAAVAPRVRSAPGTGFLADYEEKHSPLDLGSQPANVRPRSRISYVPAAALLFRSEAARSLGGFDESMRYGEDVDLTWRAVAAGHLVRYEPASVVEHRPRRNWREWLTQRIAYGSSAAALDARHPATAAPVDCSGWSLAAWAALAAGHPALGVTLAAGSSAALVRKLEAVPAMNAAALAMGGHAAAGRQLVRALLRPWWPATLGVSLVSRRARRVLSVALAVELLGRSGGLRARTVSLLDDAAYGTGVWLGAWRQRSPRALLPRVGRWP